MFRIIATKLIMENPADYGFILKSSQLYYPIETKDIEVTETTQKFLHGLLKILVLQLELNLWVVLILLHQLLQKGMNLC